MKRFFNGFAAIYICLAIFVAHSAVVTTKATAKVNSDQGRVLVEAGQSYWDYKRLDKPDEKAKDPRANYEVVVWSAVWCGPCKRYKAKEVPALLKAGFKVEVLDYDKDSPPKSVKSVPTIMLYYKGALIQSKTYWRAKDIDKYVDNHLSLKG